MKKTWVKQPLSITEVFKGLISRIFSALFICIILYLLRPAIPGAFIIMIALLIGTIVVVCLRYTVYFIEVDYDLKKVFIKWVNLFGTEKVKIIGFADIDSTFKIEKESRNAQRCAVSRLYDGNSECAKIREIDLQWQKNELEEIHLTIQDLKSIS